MQIVAIVIALALTAVAVVATTLAVRQMIAVMKQGQPVIGRTDQPVTRSVTMIKETFGHTRMLQWHWVGIMHWFVYLAFLLLSTAVLTGYFQLFDPEFALPILGHFFLFEWASEAIGLLGTVGIVFLIVYRQLNHPRRKGRSSRFYGSNFWQAYFVEAMVLLEGSAIIFIRGAEYNLGRITSDHPEDFDRFHFPLSSRAGDLLFPSGAGSEGTLENIIVGIALFKIVLAMVWLIVISRNITMGVAWHRFTAWPNIWFKREGSGRTALGAVKPLTSEGKAITLDDIDDLDEDSTLGVGQIEDFSWKGILDFTTCTECGRCQSQCPAWNTEKPLSPKLLITALRDHAYAKAAGEESAKERVLVGSGGGAAAEEAGDDAEADAKDWFYNPVGGDFVIDEDVLWSCTSCGACVQQCPVDIEHVDHIIDMRRHAVLVESNFPSELNGLFKGLENKGNPWNMSSTARMDWAKGLDFEVKVVGEDLESLDSVDWLFWVGCAGAYEDRAKKTTRAVAELLDMAGVSFGVLGNGETCTGDPARRAGNEFVFQGLAQQNAEVFKEYKVKKVVSTCAHCFNTLKNEYKEFGVELEVVHHTQLLNRLVREGKLTPVKDGAGAHKRTITYHDPCYIGRHNGVYTPPRELLQILPGATYVEMERNSERSFCCGAGGARMWMEENIGERINVNRTNEAVGTGADQIAVGCPFCRVMLSDGLTAAQAKDQAREEVEVLDVAQMLLASVKGEQATKYAPGGAPKEEAPAAKKAPTTDPEATDPEPSTDPEPVEGTDTDTVTATEDTGPAAKASGGSSLFDDPEVKDEPAATADEDKAPAEEAKAAKPASSGGSLFDLGGDGDDEPEPETAKAEEKPAQEKPAPQQAEPQDADLGTGGSLFDLGGGDEPEAKAAPETEPEPEPTAKPAADLGSGGSLFDIASPEPAATQATAPSKPAPEAKAAPEAAPEPASKAAATPAPSPSAEIPETGSLFDIEAPEPAAPAAASEPEPEADAQEAPEPDPAPEPASAEAKPAPAAGPTPASEIPESGSLFDIQAPEPAAPAADTEASPEPEPASEPEPAPEPAPAAEPEPEASTEPEPDELDGKPGTLSGGAAVSAAATAIAADDVATAEPDLETLTKPEPDAEEEPVAEPEPEQKPKPTSSGEAHEPRTDVEIGEGSLFDL